LGLLLLGHPNVANDGKSEQVFDVVTGDL